MNFDSFIGCAVGRMTFWTSKNFSISAVDQILDKEKFSLEELLQASEIIQETQSLNGRLIAYLNKPEIVSQLLEYIVIPAPLGKFPYLILLSTPAAFSYIIPHTKLTPDIARLCDNARHYTACHLSQWSVCQAW